MNDTIKVTVLHCGNVDIDASALFHDDSAHYPFSMLGFARPKDKHIQPPVLAFLIETPKGRILYDTSWGRAVREHPLRDLGLSRLVDIPILPEGQCVDERLAALGVRPEGLDYVVLSHLHIDHAGGLRQVLGAKNILVSREEYENAMHDPVFRKHMWRDAQLRFIDFAPDPDTPYDRSCDLFGDGVVKLVFLPGHTPGMTAMLLHNNGKTLLLAGDCGYARRSWEQMCLPGLVKDEAQMRRSLSWVAEIAKREDTLDCISDHETELPQTVFEF